MVPGPHNIWQRGRGKRVYAQDDLRLDLRLDGDCERGIRRARARQREIRRAQATGHTVSDASLRAELEQLEDAISDWQEVIDERTRDRATGKRFTLPPSVATTKRSRILDFAPRIT